MPTLHRISKKVRQLSLGSRQSLAALVSGSKRTLHTGDLSVINDLDKDGVHVTSIDQLFPDVSDEWLSSIKKLAAELDIYDEKDVPAHLRKMASSIDMQPDYLLSKFPEFFFLGLSRRILDLVENYLGLPAAYHGLAIRRSLVDGREEGPRLWHQDAEDFRIVRIVLYLTDVGPGDGPFEYIPRSRGLRYSDLKSIDSRIKEEEMLKVVPENAIRQCYGKAGTVIIADAANTFHHEKLQKTRARSVVMYGFSSRIPNNLSLAMRHFPAEGVKDQLLPQLSPTQAAYVYGWRR